MDNMYLKIIGAFGSIIGALIGAITTYFVVVRKKRRVVFWVAPVENVMPPQNRYHKISFKIDDSEVPRLNKGEVHVRNSGYSSILGFVFELELPGEHSVVVTEVAANNLKLRTNVKLDEEAGAGFAIVKVSLDFFNPGEAFQVITYFDGIITDCKLHFRMESVRSKVIIESEYA